jgi:hypothetical protein
MRDNAAVRGYAGLVGIILVVVGLLGFVGNPIVGSGSALFPTGALHNVVHVATGLLALYIGFGLPSSQQAKGTIGFGVLYLVVFVALIVSPTLFGLFGTPVNVADHILHAGLGIVSLAIGSVAPKSAMTTSSS